ncbi:hypothetical protein QR685DRAFT_572473 [Neurospora intermedia]|uniref:TORC1 subunit TCO89 n=1 Tax=Neurospora intermedia TaxID=5142 RepID=A0ABR3D9V8_NEUIN
MPRDRENSDTSGAPGQSKRPTLYHRDSSSSQVGGDQTGNGNTHHHRAKGPKHVVGGSRLHGKAPSSKGLHKHHGSTSTVKLNRTNTAASRQGESPTSPERPPFLTSNHRRSTSQDLVTVSTNLKNTSATALKRNRSNADVAGTGKGKAKSTSNLLKRSTSNPAVHKLKGERHSKVHFNIGDDGQDDDEDDQDEWVDASTSASPLLSRRGSTINGAETANENHLHPLASALPPQGQVDNPRVTQVQFPFPSQQQRFQPSNNIVASANNTSQQQQQQQLQEQQQQQQQMPQLSKPPTNKNSSSQTSIAPSIAPSIAHSTTTSQSHNQLLTERILKRVPSMISAPKMSTESVQVQLNASRPTSPASSMLSSQIRPGSSEKEELLTSRFVGGDQLGSTGNPSNPGESFLTGIRTTTENGTSRSMGSLEHAGHQGSKLGADSDDEGTEIRRTTRKRNGTQTSVSSGVYGGLKDLNRTQQKLNLQRASSTLDQPQVPPHHPTLGPLTPGLPLNGNGYDNRDPRLTRILERTGMEYLVVRRYQNPVARSIARIAQYQALQNGSLNMNGGGRASRPGTSHSKRGSELSGGRPNFLRDGREPRDSFLAQATINANHQHSNSMSAIPSKAVSAAARFSGLGGIGTRANSTSSSLDGDGDGGQPHVGMLNGANGGSSSRLSGSSLVDRSEHAETQAILRALWDKSLDLSVSQE